MTRGVHYPVSLDDVEPSARLPGYPGRLLSPVECLAGVLAVLLSIGLLVYLTLEHHHREQQAVFMTEAASVARIVDDALHELDTLMLPFSGMHYADSTTDDILALVADLQTRNGFVTGFGRYDIVDSDARVSFEAGLLDSGLYDFHIRDIDSAGHPAPRDRARRYYPITLLEPMTPQRLRMLGADLGAVPGLGGALERTVAIDSPLVTMLPANWPIAGELILFRAAYRGKHVPTDVEERLRQSDGGYWMTIDPHAILESASDSLERLDITLHANDTAGNDHRLVELKAADADANVLATLFPRETYTERWSVGEGRIKMTIDGELRAEVKVIAGLAVTSALLLITMLTVAAFVRNQRLADRERHANLQAVHTERERADRTLNAIDDAVFALSADHRVQHLNPAAARLVGDERADLLGRPLASAIHFVHDGTGQPLVLSDALDALEKFGRREFDVVPNALSNDSSSVVLRMTLSRTRDTAGAISGYILVFRDISDERRLTRRLEYQAHHDALTGCTNRRYFETRLGELLDDMPISGRRHALCYIDLDQFKIVNDSNGHAAGDSLLQELTVRLQSLCRRGDVLSRLGGDEFGLLIVDADEEDARAIADKIYAFFQQFEFRHADRVFAIRASIGFVSLDDRSGPIGDVLAAADMACYAAKEGGRNELYVYSADDETISQRSNELNRLPQLRRALDEDHFELYVQPVGSISDDHTLGSIEHYEFLLRLNDEDGQPITPFRIIEAAERYGLMREIDRWVISHALEHVASVRDGPGGVCSYSINLSGQSAADPTLIDFIEAQYRHYAIQPERIWFELTETAAISQFSVAVELATRIRALGSKVALDDFGSGLSSFGYLKNIPVDILKIDGQFIRNLVDDPIDRTMVQAIDDVAKSMGITTVAEFVEDAETVAILGEIGIDYAQGYFLGKPCAFADVMIALERPNRFAA